MVQSMVEVLLIIDIPSNPLNNMVYRMDQKCFWHLIVLIKHDPIFISTPVGDAPNVQ